MTDSKHGQSEALPETAELGGEGGSFGDGASRQSRERPEKGPDRVRDEVVTDLAGNLNRTADLPDRDT